MGSIINPIGWRVKHRRYWASNLMINPSSFMYSYHLQRQILEIVSSLLRYLSVGDVRKQFTLLKVLGFNFYIQNSTIFILIRIRFFVTQLWKTLFQKRPLTNYLKPQYIRNLRKGKKQRFRACFVYRRSPSTRIRRIFSNKALFTTRTRFIKRRVFGLLSKKLRKIKRLLINRVDPLLTPRRYTRMSKRIWIYFLLLPYLMYIKRLLYTTILTKISRPSFVRVFFIGFNQRSINASMVIDFLLRKLEQRKFRISRLIYDTLRILKRLVKTQKYVGYKFLMAGRFSRRDRATYIWKGYSSVPLSTKTSNIDYQYRFLQMRYSLGIFKLWISRR